MTPQEVIKEILLHIDSLEMSEAMDAVRCHTGGDAGYVKALNDMRSFIKRRFRDDTETTEAGNLNDSESLGEHLRNLLTPYQVVIDCCRAGAINKDVIKAAMRNMKFLLSFADSTEMKVLRKK